MAHGLSLIKKSRKVQFQILFYLIYFADLFLILDKKDFAIYADYNAHHNRKGQDQIKIILQRNKRSNLGKYFTLLKPVVKHPFSSSVTFSEK